MFIWLHVSAMRQSEYMTAWFYVVIYVCMCLSG